MMDDLELLVLQTLRGISGAPERAVRDLKHLLIKVKAERPDLSSNVLKGLLFALRASKAPFPEHVECCAELVAIEPHDALNYVRLGDAHLGAGNKVDAREAFERAVELSEHGDKEVLVLARASLERSRRDSEH